VGQDGAGYITDLGQAASDISGIPNNIGAVGFGRFRTLPYQPDSSAMYLMSWAEFPSVDRAVFQRCGSWQPSRRPMDSEKRHS
jgi:hypothetical protein